ncbi:lyase family protein [Cryobacterium sp. Hh38]|uniref:dioxygenase family protein n=1 Tax=Cryobacterium sp. Hh38 TaxID=1259156 RepID=UPI003512F543
MTDLAEVAAAVQTTTPQKHALQTPSQTIGPFYGYALPFAGGPELVPGYHPRAIRFHGTVTDGAGEPILHALLEIWQADGSGVLSRSRGSIDRDGFTFTGFSRRATTIAGNYTFTTVKPGAAGAAAPYILVTVFARGVTHHLSSPGPTSPRTPCCTRPTPCSARFRSTAAARLSASQRESSEEPSRTALIFACRARTRPFFWTLMPDHSFDAGLLNPLSHGSRESELTRDQARLQAMVDAALALTRALVDAELAPEWMLAVCDALGDASQFDLGAIAVEARGGGNPVIPFVKHLGRAAEKVRAGASDHIHVGATSQDNSDTLPVQFGGGVGNFAVRTEIAEVSERLAPGQGGSSAMPHKRNPVSAVLITAAALQTPGLASTLYGSMLAEDHRPSGARHAEWQSLRVLERLTISAVTGAASLASTWTRSACAPTSTSPTDSCSANGSPQFWPRPSARPPRFRWSSAPRRRPS